MVTLAHHFEEGGHGMIWVLACSIVVLGRILFHLAKLYRPRPASGAVLATLERALSAGDLGRAISEMLHTRGELARVALAGLSQGLESETRIEAAVTERLVIERAPLRSGLPLLQRVGQIATLFGLLGAIRGLQFGFCCPPDASSRALLLAARISESMNCTAYGLLVSTTALGAWWVFDVRAQVLEADLDHAALAVRNLLVRYRSRLRWLGARVPIERGMYRAAEG